MSHPRPYPSVRPAYRHPAFTNAVIAPSPSLFISLRLSPPNSYTPCRHLDTTVGDGLPTPLPTAATTRVGSPDRDRAPGSRGRVGRGDPRPAAARSPTGILARPRAIVASARRSTPLTQQRDEQVARDGMVLMSKADVDERRMPKEHASRVTLGKVLRRHKLRGVELVNRTRLIRTSPNP